jgi:putative methanogenesis marker 16 metalloprotein
MVRSFPEIRRRLERGKALILTSQEVCELVDRGDKAALEEVDVVTTATRAIMSGTYAVLSFPVARPGTFLRAKRVWINGVEASVGPCPNENLGVVDLVVFGTAHSRDRQDYGGGHLFREMVEGKPALIEVEIDEGKNHQTEVKLNEMPFARLIGSRHAFKNYSAFVNPGNKPVSTIFHARQFEPNCHCATFSGCGQINPVKNDPLLETIGMGTRILLNGAEGFVTGTGTRSSKERPNLSGFADMHFMEPEYMGGFVTSAGPECVCSWAVPIPVTSKTILQEIARRDNEICLPVMDVNTRTAIGQADYGDVWDGVDLEVEFDPARCTGCTRCLVEMACPMKAVRLVGNSTIRNDELCFHCGLCVTQCPFGAFRCFLGSIRLLTADCNVNGRVNGNVNSNVNGNVNGNANSSANCIPIVLRQSDKLRALKLAQDLKKRMLDGSFKMSQPIENIS